MSENRELPWWASAPVLVPCGFALFVALMVALVIDTRKRDERIMVIAEGAGLVDIAAWNTRAKQCAHPTE